MPRSQPRRSRSLRLRCEEPDARGRGRRGCGGGASCRGASRRGAGRRGRLRGAGRRGRRRAACRRASPETDELRAVQPVVPFVGLTGGMGAGKSTALKALARAWRAGALDRRGRARAVRREPGQAMRSSSAGARRWRLAESSTAPPIAASGVRERRTGAQVAGGPVVAARRRAHGRVARARARVASRRPRRPSWRCRCCSRPAWTSGFDATIAVIARGGHASRARRARAGTRSPRSAPRDSSPKQEKAARASFVVHNDGSVADLRRELADVLAKLSR